MNVVSKENMPAKLDENWVKQHIWPQFSRAMAGDRSRNEIYLANHSLGRPPDQLELDIQEGLKIWYEGMDLAWESEKGWLAICDHFRSLIASILNLEGKQNVIPKNNAGQALRAVLNSFPTGRILKVVSTIGEFDSADFILKAYQEAKRIEINWINPSTIKQKVPLYAADSIITALNNVPDILVISQVLFGTGQIFPRLKEIIELAHEKGVLVLLDVYHAAGIVPCELRELNPDFAVGGGYKYLRAGAGAGFLAISNQILGSNRFKTLDTGWFAKRDPMEFKRSDLPIRAEGIEGWNDSTPPVLIPYQAKSGLELTASIGVNRIRDYSLHQQGNLRTLLRSHGVTPFEPNEPNDFGGFSLVPHPEAKSAAVALRKNGVNVDARGNLLRFSPDFLNDNESLEKAAAITSKVLNG